MSGVRTLIVDNYDSFTFNLYQLIGEVNGVEPLVVRNDEFTWDEISSFAFDNVVISPGPGRPERAADFGVCGEAVLRAGVPLLGVCLGQQGIAHAYGGRVERAPEPVHGRVSLVHHDGSSLYAGIPDPFRAVRYHSLTVAPDLPECLRADAWTSDGILMGLSHRDLPLFGIQYHPESVCTEYGDVVLRNFRDMTLRPAQVGYVRAPLAQETSECRLHSRSVSFEPHHTAALFERLYSKCSNAFWLDSNEQARFSFMGAGEEVVREGLAEQLRRRRCRSDELPFDFNCGFVGYFSYEGEGTFLFADRLIAIDHVESTAWLVSCDPAEDAKAWMAQTGCALSGLTEATAAAVQKAVYLRLERDRDSYLAAIAQCQEYIRDGESYEICLTNRIAADAVPDPLALYMRMRRINPAPYGAYLRFGDVAVLSASPERFLKIGRNGDVESKPIKGTRPRGRTPEEDAALRKDLAESEKDRSENLMIVDLLRNDLGRVCEMGSVHVPQLMDVETYKTVHQLVSTVRGKLREGVDAMECVRAAFPGGSMTGAPKIRTMKLIEELEGSPRGIYSGALGFFGLNGTADLSIVIRTLVATPTETTLGVGGAIVALSDPDAEFEETLVKARASIEALLPEDADIEGVLAELRERGYCDAFSARSKSS